MLWIAGRTLEDARGIALDHKLNNPQWSWLGDVAQIRALQGAIRNTIVVLKTPCHTIDPEWIDQLATRGAAIITVNCPRCEREE